jgi:hypothetical protein
VLKAGFSPRTNDAGFDPDITDGLCEESVPPVSTVPVATACVDYDTALCNQRYRLWLRLSSGSDSSREVFLIGYSTGPSSLRSLCQIMDPTTDIYDKI